MSGQERNRQPRAVEEQRVRRRRWDISDGGRKKLAVDETQLDTRNFVYRWMHGTRARVHALTRSDDYDVMTDEALDTRRERTSLDGEEVDMILVRKPREMHEEDQAIKQRRLDEQFQSASVGEVRGAETLQGSVYVPKTDPGTGQQFSNNLGLAPPRPLQL